MKIEIREAKTITVLALTILEACINTSRAFELLEANLETPISYIETGHLGKCKCGSSEAVGAFDYREELIGVISICGTCGTENPVIKKIISMEKTLFELYLANKATTYLTHFTAPLMQAYKNADSQNRQSLDKAFPEYFLEKGNYPND